MGRSDPPLRHQQYVASTEDLALNCEAGSFLRETYDLVALVGAVIVDIMQRSLAHVSLNDSVNADPRPARSEHQAAVAIAILPCVKAALFRTGENSDLGLTDKALGRTPILEQHEHARSRTLTSTRVRRVNPGVTRVRA
jgi:hypothetical protein